MLRASAGAGRGALLTKLTFIASVTALGSILAVLKRNLALLGRCLGSLGRSWGDLGSPHDALGVFWGISWSALGCLLGRSWASLGRSWAFLGAFGAPDASQERHGDRFGNHFWSIVVQFCTHVAFPFTRDSLHLARGTSKVLLLLQLLLLRLLLLLRPHYSMLLLLWPSTLCSAPRSSCFCGRGPIGTRGLRLFRDVPIFKGSCAV